MRATWLVEADLARLRGQLQAPAGDAQRRQLQALLHHKEKLLEELRAGHSGSVPSPRPA